MTYHIPPYLPGFNIDLYKHQHVHHILEDNYFIEYVGYGDDEVGDKLYAGSHIFISENVAITPELGVTYDNFNERGESYFNTFLHASLIRPHINLQIFEQLLGLLGLIYLE